MTAIELLKTLRKLGRAQIAEIYKRHGSGDNVYGVLTSELARLQKKIKVDHALARELWKTGNAEARILAVLIADPKELTSAEAEAMVNDPQAHFVCCYLSQLVARSPIAREKMNEWMRSPREFVLEAGYGVLGFRLKEASETVAEADAERILATIRREIHRSPNFARHAMNGALIAIGTYLPALRKKAIETATLIGRVEVDHGETNCKTPDAVPAIAKASKRKRCP